MKRLALLGSLVLIAACAESTPVEPTLQLSGAGIANQSDPHDDFHNSPDLLPDHGGSHFRLGHFSWRKTGPLTAEFTYVVAFRRSAFGTPNVGNVLSLVTISFGVGQGSLSPPFTVTFVDPTNDWFEARAVFSRNFTTAGPHEVTASGCCRIGFTAQWSHHNNADDPVLYWGTVNLNFDGSPATTLPPLVTCPRNSTCTFFVPATAPGGLTVRYRLASATEMGGAPNVQPGPPQAPNAASINPTTGVYSWNTTGAIVNAVTPPQSVYSTQVVMEGVDAGNVVRTRSMIDFLILLANVAANAPPAFQPPTPADGATFSLAPGQTITLNLSATDPNAGDVVTISALGMPAGANLTGAPGNPANSIFTFAPGAGQAGQSFVVSFSPTDNKGLSGAQRSIVFNVVANQPPTARITGPASAAEGSNVTFDGSTSSDPDNDQLHYAWSVMGAPAGGDSPTLAYQVGDGPAIVTIDLYVTDGKASNTTRHILTVNNVAPQGTFNAQSPVNEAQTFSLSFTGVDDPSAADIAAIVQASFDCGDGSGYGPFSTSLSVTCPTSDNGTRGVRGRLRDKDGGETEYAAAVAVNNVAPTVNAGPDVSIISGQTVSFSGTFSDPGVNDAPWSYLWSFGASGSASTQPGPVTASRQFCSTGAHVVSLTVTDKDGGAGADQLTVNVAPLDVSIRVLPETINLNGNKSNSNGQGGMIIVHVFSSGDFNAAALDPATLRLTNGSGSGTAVARRNNGSYYFQTVGNGEAIIHFDRADLIANGDLTSATTQLMLFGTEGTCRRVSGVDDVRVIH